MKGLAELAIQKKKEKQFKGIARGAGGGALDKLVRIALGVFLGVALILCLYGYINQVQTGKTIMESVMGLGKDLSDVAMTIITGEEDSPVDVTDQGVYIDGHAPDGASELQLDEGETQDNNNQNDNQNE